jgi:uncharacterized protein (DUF4415 family)
MQTGTKAAKADFNATLDRLQNDLMVSWVDKSVPDDWSGLDTWAPVEPHKLRITVRLDADMVRWFKKLGPGYGARMNLVLRLYWKALQAGLVHGYENDDVLPRIRAQAVMMAEER